MTRKCAATTAEQAFTPQNILRAQLHWTTPWPIGIVGANYKNDSDEFGLWVEKANPLRGKAPRGIAVRQAGKYGHGDKFTCVISIMEDGRRDIKNTRPCVLAACLSTARAIALLV